MRRDQIGATKSLLSERIIQAKADLATMQEQHDSNPRRRELEASTSSVEALPVHERQAALAGAGITVEQFQAAVLELDGMSGKVSTAKHRVRQLEAELADLEAAAPQDDDAWMKIPSRNLSLREENIIGNIVQVVFEAHTPAREAAQAALDTVQADHRGDTSPAAERAIMEAQEALHDAEAAETADVQRIIWITALRVAYRSGILAYAGALVDANPVRATAILMRNMIESSEATDHTIAAGVEQLLTDGPGILAILGNKYPGTEPLFRK